MEILLPTPETAAQDWPQKVQVLAQQPFLPPFDPILLDFIHTVSNELMSSRQIRPYTELIAMAYWMRKSHIQHIIKMYYPHNPHSVLMPRGIVFHIAPANVDSIFMYSWFLSLLTGNSNIIRLSSRHNKAIETLLYIINSIIRQDCFEPIRRRNLILSYGHEDEITKILSENCQVRVIWGGDETIRHIRSIPLPPGATEIPFADRFSFCALQAKEVAGAPPEQLKKLAHDFFNDAFWFNQNACSSPRLVIWIGNSDDILTAKQRFWDELRIVIAEKNPGWDGPMLINRMAAGYHLAAMELTDSLSSPTAELPYRVHIKNLSPELRRQHTGNGMFFETELTNLCDLKAFISQKEQTLSVYGFCNQELRDFAKSLRRHTPNRIVPVGRALDFHPVWDGTNLLTAFCRECTISEDLS